MVLEPIILGSNLGDRIIYFILLFLMYFCHYYYSANSTLLSLLRFSYFITPDDAQASSAFDIFLNEFLSLTLAPATDMQTGTDRHTGMHGRSHKQRERERERERKRELTFGHIYISWVSVFHIHSHSKPTQRVMTSKLHHVPALQPLSELEPVIKHISYFTCLIVYILKSAKYMSLTPSDSDTF